MPTDKKTTLETLPITIEQVDGDGFHIFCQIKTSGKSLRAIIDTGASKTVFSEKTIDTLGDIEIIQQGENMAAGIGSESVEAKIAVIPRIYLGKKQVRNLLVGVMDTSHIDRQYLELGLKPFDIILGSDILKAKKCSISYADKVLLVM